MFKVLLILNNYNVQRTMYIVHCTLLCIVASLYLLYTYPYMVMYTALNQLHCLICHVNDMSALVSL